MIRIFHENTMQISNWSGGTTKQLYIYPEDASYTSRNFMMRLSIATTESETSVFTSLEGVDRVISILEGEMELSHTNQHTSLLKPYDIDRFKGEWESSSKGKVTDFNLMLKGCKGDFFYKTLQGQEKIQCTDAEAILFIYCISGTIQAENHIFSQGSLLITDEQSIDISTKDAKIFYGYAHITGVGV